MERPFKPEDVMLMNLQPSQVKELAKCTPLWTPLEVGQHIAACSLDAVTLCKGAYPIASYGLFPVMLKGNPVFFVWTLMAAEAGAGMISLYKSLKRHLQRYNHRAVMAQSISPEADRMLPMLGFIHLENEWYLKEART